MTRNKGDTLDFPSLDAAKQWLTARGYVYGPMQREAPIGVMPGETHCGVSKWRNMTAAEQRECVAVLTVLHGPDALRLWDRPWRLTWQHQHREVSP